MLSKSENDFLTLTGPGTPMGALFRHYWLPALLSAEVPERDGTPVRVRVLGEDLVAFRDSTGAVGLIEPVCAHRGANLFFGRNEDGGIRCIFHGWKFDRTGACLEMPSVPVDQNYERLRPQMGIVAYPTHECGDYIWAYMGPGEPPPFPAMEFGLVPAERRFATKKLQQCNWAQAMEGALDTAHFSFLHTSLDEAGALAVMARSEAAASGDADRVRWLREDGIPRFSTIEHPAGIAIGAARKADAGRSYWRISQYLLPNHALVPSTFPGENYHGQTFVPIDDYSCWIYTYTWNPDRALSETERARYAAGHTIHSAVDEQWIPIRRRENDYLIDRRDQKLHSFTGIAGVSEQDAAVQDSQGYIADRTREHLGITDVGLLQFRKSVMEAARSLAAGTVPPSVFASDGYCVRGGGWVAPVDMPLEDVMTERFGNTIGAAERERVL
jgi:phenylpropionate dioxygenase-like ring-hydroxylating dioxygenase large terminal subunit